MYTEIDDNAPLMEPQRQFYYMEQCKKYVDKMKEKLGRTPTFCVQTFGCQMNFHDSEKIIAILEKTMSNSLFQTGILNLNIRYLGASSLNNMFSLSVMN